MKMDERTEDAMIQGEDEGNDRKTKDDEMADDVIDQDKSFLTKLGLTLTLYFGFIVTVIHIEHIISSRLFLIS